MKKEIYYKVTGSPAIYTEREVKLLQMDKKYMNRVLLTKDEVEDVGFGRYNFEFRGGLNDLSTKDLRKAKVRKDLMRLGIEW